MHLLFFVFRLHFSILIRHNNYWQKLTDLKYVIWYWTSFSVTVIAILYIWFQIQTQLCCLHVTGRGLRPKNQSMLARTRDAFRIPGRGKQISRLSLAREGILCVLCVCICAHVCMLYLILVYWVFESNWVQRWIARNTQERMAIGLDICYINGWCCYG